MTTHTKDSAVQDVVIMGGGPAGTAAGLTLLQRKGVRVTVVESSSYEAPRIGESLSPGVRPLLEYLGVWESFQREQTLRSHGSSAAWGGAEAHSLDYMFTVHGSGWGLDRVGLDRMLASEFEQRGGTMLRSTRFVECARSEDGWTVGVRAGDTDCTLRCRFLIDASGRRSLVARHLGVVRVQHDDLVGVASVGTAPGGHPRGRSPIDNSVLVEACDYGWWYSAPVPGQQMSTVLMSDPDIVRSMGAARRSRWTNLLRQTGPTGRRLDGWTTWSTPRVFNASSSRLTEIGGDGWVAVGDAAASHDPLSSSGIPHAMGTGTQGAIVAANALFGNGEGLTAYQNAIQDDFRRYLDTHWRYYQREDRFLDQPFWQRRRTPVAIDPQTEVEADIASGHRSTVHLPARLTSSLRTSVQTGGSAHRIVRRFSDLHPEIAHQRVILGLQDLSQRVVGRPRP